MHSKEKPYRCTFIIPPGREEDRGEFGFKRKPSEPVQEGGEGDGRECGARFSTNQHLKRHVESHLKTFPYIVSWSIGAHSYDAHHQILVEAKSIKQLCYKYILTAP